MRATDDKNLTKAKIVERRGGRIIDILEKILEATLKWKMKPENHLHLMIERDDKRQNCGRSKMKTLWRR